LLNFADEGFSPSYVLLNAVCVAEERGHRRHIFISS
jgi:hypothetical protein